MAINYCSWNAVPSALIVNDKPLGGVSISAAVGASANEP